VLSRELFTAFMLEHPEVALQLIRWRLAKSVMLALVLIFAGVQFYYFYTH
jgi:hypothetical protein